MKLLILLDNVTVDGDGLVVNPQTGMHEFGIVQVSVTGGTGTVKIQGRLSINMPWVDIITFTVSDSARIALMPHMKANVSGISGATIRAELGA